MKKRTVAFLLSVISVLMLCASALPVGAATAEPEIMPLWTHTGDYTFQFAVADPDTAHVYVSYSGYSTFSQAKLTIKIQKRFLGLFWDTVDIGHTDNEWVAYSSNSEDYFSNTFTVNGTGTYRAKMTLEITGTDGSVDTIEDTIEYKYS